jgi:tRNA threonylcarbamoyladenosine biosynthesis protein TsaE
MEWVFSEDNINHVAKEFWEKTEGNTVFAFHGQMGAGKTTFIHALCDAKNVTDTVGSPTFSIINEYRLASGTGMDESKSLYHMDLYRLRDEEEAIRAGVEDILYSGSICLVEWPEKAPGIFPEGTVHVYIELVDNRTRRLKIADI